MTNPPNNNPPPSTNSSSDSDSSQPVDHKRDKTPPFNLHKREENARQNTNQSPWDPKPKKKTNNNAPVDPKKEPPNDNPDPWIQGSEKKQKKEDDDQGQMGGNQNPDPSAQFNLSQATNTSIIAGAEAASSRSADSAIADVVNSISDYIKSMSVSEANASTTVTMTIQSGSVFNGSQVEITRTGGEHNIVFRNLSEQAQLLLENRTNQAHLREGLEMNGVTVHVISTERMDQPLTTQNSQSSEQDRGSRDDDQGQGGGGRQRDQESEQ
ncbi:MAG: hypothetical protein JHC93_02650 [Parachlamydiales bacterium]|nr:hypothetical protein [Parachlamydiales bacterium]